MPLATSDREMHQLVLRKSQTLELPHVEKIHLQMGHLQTGYLQTILFYVNKNASYILVTICEPSRIPNEAIRGSEFFSAQVDAYPYHEWSKATSDIGMCEKKLDLRIASCGKATFC